MPRKRAQMRRRGWNASDNRGCATLSIDGGPGRQQPSFIVYFHFVYDSWRFGFATSVLVTCLCYHCWFCGRIHYPSHPSTTDFINLSSKQLPTRLISPNRCDSNCCKFCLLQLLPLSSHQATALKPPPPMQTVSNNQPASNAFHTVVERITNTAQPQSHTVKMESMNHPKRVVLRFSVQYEREEATMNEQFFALHGPKPLNR